MTTSCGRLVRRNGWKFLEKCAAGIFWDVGAQLHKNVSSQSLDEYVYEEVWSLSSGVVGRRRLFVTNSSLKYRDADGFLMALLQHNRSVNE